tara:strand:- start:52948 stop:53412 length:465 start_codon:yes stop_codon:yes gene_type:complete
MKTVPMKLDNSLPTNQKVPVALKIIEAQLAALNIITETAFKTSGDFRWAPNMDGGRAINLYKVTSIPTLISVHQYIKAKNLGYADSAKDLSLDKFEVFTWQNFTFKDWEHDIKIRLAVVRQVEERNRLEQGKDKLEKFLSEDQQLEGIFDDLKL